MHRMTTSTISCDIATFYINAANCAKTFYVCLKSLRVIISSLVFFTIFLLCIYRKLRQNILCIFKKPPCYNLIISIFYNFSFMYIEKHDMIIRCLLILWNQRWREQQFRASYVVTSFLPRTLLINDLRELGSPSARSILITFATSVQNTTAQEKNGTLNWTKNWLTHFWRRKIFVCFSGPSTSIGSCNNVEKYTKSKKD